jgi:hypothetical protein
MRIVRTGFSHAEPAPAPPQKSAGWLCYRDGFYFGYPKATSEILTQLGIAPSIRNEFGCHMTRYDANHLVPVIEKYIQWYIYTMGASISRDHQVPRYIFFYDRYEVVLCLSDATESCFSDVWRSLASIRNHFGYPKTHPYCATAQNATAPLLVDTARPHR